MTPVRKWLLVGIIALLLGGSLLQPAAVTNVTAQEGATVTPTGGVPYRRLTKIIMPFVKYKWWMIRWSNNLVVCTIYTEHEGLPKLFEIEGQCDPNIYTEWTQTKPCSLAEVNSTTECKGFYLQQISAAQGSREVEVELPLPTVWVSIDNCNSPPGDTRCTTLPNLVFTGQEPLPNEMIIDIQGKIAGEPFVCHDNTCRVPLQPTGLEGVDMEFWANSSFGDQTPHFTAKVRLVPWGAFMNPEKQSKEPVSYYVDVISSQWRGAPIASCSDTWQSFPPVGGPPDWLSSPTDAQGLGSDVPYYYLAGALITYGIVDASSCVDGGLQAPNIASPCGVEVARPELGVWQNRFDEQILKASAETGLPARLLKNIFSRESQIWPGLFRTYKETGLGQLTENGADTILLWNPDFFHQFCPLVLNKQYCDLGYGNLTTQYPDLLPLLRGALVKKVDASCPDCPASIDLKEADYSVHVFAEGLLANCEQVGRMITNLTDLSPGRVSSYEDLWRFTLVNYNAGPGCLSNAIRQAYTGAPPLTWDSVAENLEPACQIAVGYVEDISQMLLPTPTPTVWLPFTGQPPTPALPRVLNSPTPTLTIGPTPVVPPTAIATTTRTPSPTSSGPTPTQGTTTPSPSPTITPTATDTP